jgi:hypothetical protein
MLSTLLAHGALFNAIGVLGICEQNINFFKPLNNFNFSRVNAKEAPKTSKGKNDSLRYEYDDHYFLTDPREFIYEFFPLQEEWQLLKRPITLREFENLPFVRSLFFRYGLHFADDGYGAVVFTDDTGAATVRIAM